MATLDVIYPVPGILALPTELLERILTENSLNHTDLSSVARVCSHLRDVTHSNEVWRHKFRHRYADLWAQYPPGERVQWMEEYHSCLQCQASVSRVCAAMSAMCHHKEDVPEIAMCQFVHMVQAHERAAIMVMDALRKILQGGSSGQNLTHKYYASRALKFIGQIYMRQEWQSFLETPPEKQLLESGAVLLSRWFQQELNLSQASVGAQLDGLSGQVCEYLQEQGFNNLAAAPLTQHQWQELSCSNWHPTESRKILNAINHVLFVKLGFQGNESNYYEANNSFINRVILRMVRNLETLGRHHRDHDNFTVYMLALELGLVLQPSNIDVRLQLVQVYTHLKVNYSKALSLLDDVLDEAQVGQDIGRLTYLRDLLRAKQQMEQNEEEVKVKKRSDPAAKNMQYSVGMVMKHTRYHYLCVVSGWDTECQASEEWVQQMGVHLLPKRHLQSFYNVLASDGSSRYAAEENLECAPCPEAVTHPEIGKYFEEFTGTHYIANPEKQSLYPEDQDFTNSKSQTMYATAEVTS